VGLIAADPDGRRLKAASAMARASRYWNPVSELRPPAEAERLQLRRVQAAIRHAYTHSAMYRRRYDQAGVRPEAIRTWGDFIAKVPALDKKDILEAQALRPPYGTALAVPENRIAYRFQTSGTTGVPLLIPMTWESCVLYGEPWAYLFWSVGLRPGDAVFFPFNWGTFIGFWAAYWGVRRLGGTVISGGGLDTRARLQMLLQARPAAVVGTPTYLLHLAEVAHEANVRLPDARVRVLATAGEPGASIPTTRRAIEEAWGAKVYELYGIGEVGSIGPGCPGQGGVHLCEDVAASLVIGADGRPVAEGEVGEHLVTSFGQHAQPLIKYRSHDLVRWRRGRCPDCGRTWITFPGGVLGRTDHMILIKGTNVYPTAVEAIVGEVRGLSEHLEAHVSRGDAGDRMAVKVEASAGVQGEMYAEMGRRAEELLRRRIGVRIGVEVLAPGALPRYELKSQRFFDHRPKEHQWQLPTGARR
jgi:phenylacetate-CoA ligase